MSWRFSKFRIRPPPLLPTTITTIQILAAYHLFTSTICEIRLCSGYSMLPTLSHEGDLVLISPLPYFFRSFSFSLPFFKEDNFSTSKARKIKGPERGDLVFAISPRNPIDTVCKRVIGIEGDIIEIEPRRGAIERKWIAEEDRAYSEISSSFKNNSFSINHDHERDTNEKEINNNNNNGVVVVDDHYNRIYSNPNPPSTQIRTLDSEGRPIRLFRHGRRGENRFIKIPKGYVWLSGDNLSNSTDSRHYGPVPIGMIKGKVLARVGVM